MKFSKKILLFILIIINIFIFYKLNNNNFNFKYVFKPSCEINNISDLEKCYNTNPNVVINISQIYETGYKYINDNYVFVDINVSDKTLIGIIRKADINNKKIYGKLETKNNIISKEVIRNIKKEYQEKMELNNIDELFIPLVLNAYDYKNNHSANLIYGCLFILTLILIIYVGIKVVKEEKI